MKLFQHLPPEQQTPEWVLMQLHWHCILPTCNIAMSLWYSWGHLGKT